jgi:hypothetical protein
MREPAEYTFNGNLPHSLPEKVKEFALDSRFHLLRPILTTHLCETVVVWRKGDLNFSIA